MNNLAAITYHTGRVQIVGLFPKHESLTKQTKEKYIINHNGLEIVANKPNPSKIEMIQAVRLAQNGGKSNKASEPKDEKAKKHELAWIDRSRIVLGDFYNTDKIMQNLENFLPKAEAHVFDLEDTAISVRYFDKLNIVFQKIKNVHGKLDHWWSLEKNGEAFDFTNLALYDINSKLRSIRGFGGQMSKLTYADSQDIPDYQILVLPAENKLHDWVKEEIASKKWTVHEYNKQRENLQKEDNINNGISYKAA